MKRFLAILICISMIFSVVGSVAVFAEDTGAADVTDGTEDDTVVSTPDSAEQHGNKPLDDTAEQIVYVDPNEITVEVKKELINSAELHPMTTGYEPLDDLVADIHSKILTPTMDTYEKVCAIYKYLMTDKRYEFGNQTSNATYNSLIKSHNYKSKIDYYIVYNAYGMLVENYGVCNHYSSAFMVMTRALGLESYIATCTSSIRGLGGHFSAMIRLKGRLYRFDPVMGVVTNKVDIVDDSEFFCTPMASQVSSEFSFIEEQVACFGNFEMYSYSGSFKKYEPQGKTEGDVRFSFGSYPQTEVTDIELIEQLNEQLNGVTMNYYPYSCGTDEPGSQERCEYMSWVDITFNNQKYRAVKIDEYRPKYIYRTHEKDNSQQFRVGYDPGNIYWFKYEPIEWRLADGNNLLIADLVLDAQPFNDSLYYSDKGKRVNGRMCYVFSDEEMTHPANDWEYSSIRRWLNDEFYNTAFSPEEQQIILDSELKDAHGFLNIFEYNETTDKVFLPSLSEVNDSKYYIAESYEARRSDCSDYAKCQGASSKRNEDTYGFSSAWLLRSPGMHSGEISLVANYGGTQMNVNAGSTNAGIKPVLRAEPLSSLFADLTEAPDKPKAYATDTGQITLRSNVVNGVDGYKFYVYSDDETKPDVIYTSLSPVLVINDLIPGKVYSFRSTAYRLTEGQLVESPMSEMARLMCRTLVEPPENITAEPVSTGTVRLSFEPVEGAVEYRVYKYIDSDTLDLCAVSAEPVIDVTGLKVGSPCSFKLTSVSDDGYESKISKETVSCMCESFPKRPENIVVEPCATHKLQISWDAVSGAASYNVYSFYSADDIELIASTSDTSVIVSDLRTNLTYYYKVEAVGENGRDVSALSGRVGGTCISIPPAPKISSVEPSATHKLEITWEAVEGAATYNVYRYFSAQGLVLLGTTDKLSYVVSDLKTGDNCYFRVEAVSEDGEDISEVSSMVGGECVSIPPMPQNPQVRPYSTGSVEVSWDAVDGADTYNVYRYYAAEGLVLLGTTDKTSYIVSDLSTSEKCFFKVEAVANDGNDISDISALAGGTCESIPPIPTNLQVQPRSTNSVEVSWDAVEGADVYNIYRYLKTEGLVKLGTTGNTSFTVPDLNPGDNCYFKVEAVANDGKDVSEMSELVSGTCESIPPTPANVQVRPSGTGRLTVSWEPSQGADIYNVYRFYSKTNSEFLGRTTNTSFEVSGYKTGDHIFFQVEAATADGKDISTLSSLVSGVCESYPAVPQNVVYEPVATGVIKLSWEPSEGAAKYNVYRYFTPSNMPLLGTTEKPEFIVNDLVPSSNVFFKIEAISEDGKDISDLTPLIFAAAASIPDRPQNIVAYASSTGCITVKWDAVEGAGSYNVYRYYSASRTDLICNTEDTSYTMSGLNPGADIYFKIQSVSVDGKDIGALSSSVNAVAESIPPAPANLTAYTANRPLAVDLKWDPVEGATGYEIYKYSDTDKAYVLFGKTDKTEFEAVGIKGGSQARFTVTAVKEDGDQVHVSLKSNVATALVNKLAAPTNVTAACTETREITLRWDPVPFADRYDVYLYDKVDKEYYLGASSYSEECKIVSLDPDTTVTFRVAAVGEFDTFELSSDFSSSVSCKALSGPEAVQQLSAAQMSDGKVKLSWNAVSGATQYNVYSVSTGEGGSDELLGTTETTSFSAENLSKGRIYRLYVRAIKVKDDITLTGDSSSQVIVDIPADESYIIGDADGSGSVDIVDATFVQRYATSIKVPVPLDTLMHADIDGDGSIGVIDATFIQRYVTFIFIPYLIDCPAV